MGFLVGAALAASGLLFIWGGISGRLARMAAAIVNSSGATTASFTSAPSGFEQLGLPNSSSNTVLASDGNVGAGGGYVNPLTFGNWSIGRTDQGVDLIPNTPSPVVAIGSGKVTYSSTNAGWPGGAFISYLLDSGPDAGKSVYVAEHLTNLLPVGATVQPGQQIATALPGYPWTEWGWAASPNVDLPLTPGSGATPGGVSFANFLQSLGLTVQ